MFQGTISALAPHMMFFRIQTPHLDMDHLQNLIYLLEALLHPPPHPTLLVI